MTVNLDTRLARLNSPVLTAFRIIFGLLYTLHGSMKLFGWPLGAAAPVGAWPYWWAGLIEFVLGIMITVGILTRIAAFIASGEMAFAYFYNHWPPLTVVPPPAFGRSTRRWAAMAGSWRFCTASRSCSSRPRAQASRPSMRGGGRWPHGRPALRRAVGSAASGAKSRARGPCESASFRRSSRPVRPAARSRTSTAW